MTEAEFSARPWHVDIGTSGELLIVRAPSVVLASVAPGTQMAADAWLMAAAPDLYEALLPFTLCDPKSPPPSYHHNEMTRYGWDMAISNASRAIRSAQVRR